MKPLGAAWRIIMTKDIFIGICSAVFVALVIIDSIRKTRNS